MMVRVCLGVLLFMLSVAAPSPAAGQSTPAPADVSQGKKLFEGMCARCHGIAIAAGYSVFVFALP